jgi:hypothetical protein
MKSLASLAVICLQATAQQQFTKQKHRVGSSQYHDSWVDKPDFDSTYKAFEDIKTAKVVEHGRRPVIGILTEPLRGDLLDLDSQGPVSYVPKTHV